MRNPVGINASFIHSLDRHGNELMIKMAIDMPQAFQAAIDDGWADMGPDHWFRQDFFCRLPNIQDPHVAAHALKEVLKNRTVEQINATLLNHAPSEGVPVRRWFTHSLSTRRSEWRSVVLKQAIEVGLDLNTEFSHSIQGVDAQKCTLMASFILDAKNRINEKTHNWSTVVGKDNVTYCLEPIIELLEHGAKLDKSSLSVLLKHHNGEGLISIFKQFDQRGLLDASKCLKAVSRMKIAPQNLAYLQSKVALETMNDVLNGSSSFEKKAKP